MKKLLSAILLAFVAMTMQAKTFKTIKAPKAMACVNVSNGELRARDVIFRDTATTIHFTMTYPKGQMFRFDKGSYLLDENGQRYPLRSAENIALDSWIKSPESGITDFTMHFEPLPKKVQIFDFIEGDVSRAFMLLGIHDQKLKIKAPTMQELAATNPYTVPQDWFRTDTITVKGRIEDYNSVLFGYNSMECYFQDVFSDDATTLVLDIAPDGTFCKKFQASYPVMQEFFCRESRNGFSQIPFFARPGETIDITVKRNEYGMYQCYYNNGSSRDVQNWLRNTDIFNDLAYPLHMYKGTIAEATQKAEEVWQNMIYRLQSVSRQYRFTPMEMQLAMADLQVNFAYAWMDYMMYHEDDVRKYVKLEDGGYRIEIVDSVENRAISDEKYYELLHRVDFDDPLLLASNHYSILLNRIQFARPALQRRQDGMMDEKGVIEYNASNVIKGLGSYRSSLRKLMGTDHDNEMIQHCTYKNYINDFNSWRSNEDLNLIILADTTKTEAERRKEVEENCSLSNMYPVYLASFSDPYIHQKAEAYYAYKMAQKDLSTPLPDAPKADLIRQLTQKYPGRFLIIDFWGMGCGPCRSAIESSKQTRAQIAQRDDVKLIFIAGERTAEGSDAYKKYVAEWLADEEAICVTNADFTRLQELFQFNGIPHYETITPDCRRVRDDLRLNGLYNIDWGLSQLKEKLK